MSLAKFFLKKAKRLIDGDIINDPLHEKSITIMNDMWGSIVTQFIGLEDAQEYRSLSRSEYLQNYKFSPRVYACFEELLTNPTVKKAFAKWGDRMLEKKWYDNVIDDKELLTHPRRAMVTAYIATQLMLPDQALPLAKLLSESDAFRVCTKLPCIYKRYTVSDSVNASSATIKVISALAEGLSVNDKLEFFKTLEKDDFIIDWLEACGDDTVAVDYVCSVFKDVDEATVNAMLSTSEILDNVEWSSEVRDQILENNPKMLSFIHRHCVGDDHDRDHRL